jgi:epoxyqueuosine reductase QueG
MSIRDEIEGFLRKFGAFKVGVASPEQGFRTAKSGCHPKDVMKNCNSVIVFAFHVGLDYYTTLDFCQKEEVESRVLNIYRDWVAVKLVHFLEDLGYEAVFPHGYMDEEAKIARLSIKLAAYEAGLGVFGRPSILITPEYGPRVIFRAVLTNASMLPDKPLTDFDPCRKCGTCVRLCPVNAIDERLPPPTGFNRDRCVQFVYKIREKTSRKIMYCGYCFNCCPVGEIAEKTFRLDRWKTLLDLDEHERERLLEVLNTK